MLSIEVTAQEGLDLVALDQVALDLAALDLVVLDQVVLDQVVMDLEALDLVASELVKPAIFAYIKFPYLSFPFSISLLTYVNIDVNNCTLSQEQEQEENLENLVGLTVDTLINISISQKCSQFHNNVTIQNVITKLE